MPLVVESRLAMAKGCSQSHWLERSEEALAKGFFMVLTGVKQGALVWQGFDLPL